MDPEQNIREQRIARQSKDYDYLEILLEDIISWQDMNGFIPDVVDGIPVTEEEKGADHLVELEDYGPPWVSGNDIKLTKDNIITNTYPLKIIIKQII